VVFADSSGFIAPTPGRDPHRPPKRGVASQRASASTTQLVSPKPSYLRRRGGWGRPGAGAIILDSLIEVVTIDGSS
jgi:hypothetical protein